MSIHSFNETSQLLNIKLQVHEAVWAIHCGIINFNSAISMGALKISEDTRFILAKITILAEQSFDPFYVLSVHATASNSSKERSIFSPPLWSIYIRYN
jgi:hypothetical protein